jgi:hypothetical protein
LRAQSPPRLLAYFLLRLFHLHESNIRANSIRLPACYCPDPSSYPAVARDVMGRRIRAHGSTAAQELVVAIFMLVDEPTALVLSSTSPGCLVEVMIAMAAQARSPGFQEPTNV